MLKQITRLSLAFIVFASLAGLAVAHEHDNRDLRSANQYGYRNGYVDGFQHGREDRLARAGYRLRSHDYDNSMRGYEAYMGNRDHYRKGYRQGYVAGYNDGFKGYEARFAIPQGSARYENGDSDQSGPAPAYGRGSPRARRSVAFQIGYRDGMIAGGKDRRKNKKFRPTKNEKYEDADHGYKDDYGSKKEYKREYREGFVAGYDRGYGNSYSSRDD